MKLPTYWARRFSSSELALKHHDHSRTPRIQTLYALPRNYLRITSRVGSYCADEPAIQRGVDRLRAVGRNVCAVHRVRNGKANGDPTVERCSRSFGGFMVATRCT